MARSMFRMARPLALLGATTAMFTGCTRDKNDQLRLGACEVLPVFQTEPHQLPPAGPSVTGLDRSNWEPMVYVVPVNGVAHQPQYAPPVFDLGTLARQRGDFPTALDALDKGEPDVREEIWLAMRTHGWAFLDGLALVPRLVYRPPTATNWSPRESYGRASPASIDTHVSGEGCCADACDGDSPTEPQTQAPDTTGGDGTAGG